MINIVPNRQQYIPTMVSPQKLESLWPIDDLYVAAWSGEPLSDWFRLDDYRNPTAFRTADVRVSTSQMGPSISFLNGRHRTRWLLQQGLTEIPIGIYVDELNLAISLGLTIRPVGPQDLIAKPVFSWSKP